MGGDAASLRTDRDVVVDPASGRRLGYGAIAAFAKVPATLPAVTGGDLKPKNQFRLIGKDMPRRDIPLKVNGAAQFAIDVDLPGMVYARELRRPVLIWTREEDIAHGMFRPQSFQCLEAALDKDGKVSRWTHCVVGDGGGLLSSRQ